jgi:hypothetical protein
MFDGRIGSDGNATVKTFVIGSYFTRAFKSRKKAGSEQRPQAVRIKRLGGRWVFPQGPQKTVPRRFPGGGFPSN